MSEIAIICPSCRAANEYSELQVEQWRYRPSIDRRCRQCNFEFSVDFDSYQKAPVDYQDTSLQDEIDRANQSGDYSKLSTSAVARLTERMLLTTESSLEPGMIERTLGVITAECVFGMNVFRDMFASMRDFFGGRSIATQKVLRESRAVCLTELKREAL